MTSHIRKCAPELIGKRRQSGKLLVEGIGGNKHSIKLCSLCSANVYILALCLLDCEICLNMCPGSDYLEKTTG